MTNPFPFTGGNILNASDLNAIGETESWTPNFLSGVTVGDGTVEGTYQRVNDFVIVQGRFVLGSTSAITGNVRTELPVNASATFELSNGTIVQIVDTSANRYYRGSGRGSNVSSVNLHVLQADTAGNDCIHSTGFSSSRPMTWASGDRFEWLSIYRVGT